MTGARRRSLASPAALVLALAACASAAAQEGEGARVEGIAALVGGNTPGPGTVVILRSDVVLRARIALAGGSEELPSGPVPVPLLGAILHELIGEAMIEREADRLRAAQPGGEEIARERERIEAQAGGSDRLAALVRALGASSGEVEAIARRRAYVSAFLRANLEGSTAVSEAQLARVHESGEHPFRGRALDDVREPLRAWIAQQALQRDVARWIDVLRRRTTVRVMAEWPEGGDDE